jgi:hypothetical protein
MLMGLSPTIIPPGRKPDIIQFRKKLRRGRSSISVETLVEWDVEIRQLYFDIDQSLHTRPQLCNTDGDPMEFHRLIYEISSAEEAFEKLCDLCVTAKAEDLRADAKRDGAGRIVRIEFPWDRLGHKASPGMPNTVLGHICINKQLLTAEVNSAARAKALRSEIAVRLGDHAHFKVDEIRDVEAMMNEVEAGRSHRQNSADQDELMQHPEVREKISAMICKHWESWVNQKIPALGGKTPKQAVKSKDGREAVEALLRDAERNPHQDPLTREANRNGTRRVRELLGLDVQKK